MQHRLVDRQAQQGTTGGLLVVKRQLHRSEPHKIRGIVRFQLDQEEFTNHLKRAIDASPGKKRRYSPVEASPRREARLEAAPLQVLCK